jgi:HAD superfamily hydrolase (TIGR01509 family)
MSRSRERSEPLSRPAAVLWDMDGTLLDSEKLWDIPLYEAAERLGGTLSLPARQAMVGSNVPTTLDILFTDVGLTPDAEERAEVARFIDKRIAELFAENLPWQPGAQQALATVAASGLPMALVTSTGRDLTEVALDTIGRHYFLATVCGDEVDGLNKPHPEPYRKAARLLGVDPTRCVAIEDSPTGVASAAGAGCTVLVVPSEVPVPQGERRVFRSSLVGLRLADLGIPGPGEILRR